MNKDLDKKLQMYIISKAIQSMPFGREWDSSAKKLEDELEKRGIKLSQKLYYKYKMPGELKPEEFMDSLIIDYFIAYFHSWFAKDVLKDKQLKMSEKAKIFTYVWKNRSKYKGVLEKYETEIRQKNPELSGVKVNNPKSLVYGALFGFAPKEISYFSDGAHRDLVQEEKNRNLFESYGINLTYVLAPDTAKKIIALLKQNVQNNIKER